MLGRPTAVDVPAAVAHKGGSRTPHLSQFSKPLALATRFDFSNHSSFIIRSYTVATLLASRPTSVACSITTCRHAGYRGTRFRGRRPSMLSATEASLPSLMDPENIGRPPPPASQQALPAAERSAYAWRRAISLPHARPRPQMTCCTWPKKPGRSFCVAASCSGEVTEATRPASAAASRYGAMSAKSSEVVARMTSLQAADRDRRFLLS